MVTIIIVIAVVAITRRGEIVDYPGDRSETDTVFEEKDVVGPPDEAKGFVDGKYTLDTGASSITWTGRRPILEVSHTGTFGFLEGSAVVEDGVITEGNFVIDMQSMSADGSGVLKYLLSDIFFSVDTYPEAEFTLVSVSDRVGRSTLRDIEGVLTIKNKTNKVKFRGQVNQEQTEYADNVIRTVAAFEIDRTKWGIRFGSGSFFDDVGDKIIDDMVTIKFDLWANLTES